MIENEKKFFIKIMYYLIFLIGILILLYSCFDYVKLKKVCTKELNVECIDVYKQNDYYRDVYAPIWKGIYNNKEIIFESDYTSQTHKIGEKEIIKINPNNLNEFIDSDKIKGNNIQLICLIIFTIVYFFFFYIGIKNYRKEIFEKKLREI